MEVSEAEQMFWKIPEVVERLYSWLDPASALHLVQSRVMDKNTLQKSLSSQAWNKLIRRSSRDENRVLQKEDVKDLVKILKLMELEEPSTLLLPLLDLVCVMQPLFSRDYVKMVCPNHQDGPDFPRHHDHFIATDAFLLLEEVEAAFGTSEQVFESIDVSDLQEPLLSAIVSRVSRQKELKLAKSERIKAEKVFIKNQSTAQAFTSLLLDQRVWINCLEVSGPIGEENWQGLAKALQGSRPRMAGVFVSKQGLAEVKKDDLKDIWEATMYGFQVVNFSTYRDEAVLVDKSELDWDAAWTRLSQISDMTDDEFVTAADNDSDEEEGSNEDGDSGEEEKNKEGDESEEEKSKEEEDDGEKEGKKDDLVEEHA